LWANRRLPTLDELSAAYSANCASTLSLVSNRYWSSTESSAVSAWRLLMSNGLSSYYNKSSVPYVVCVYGG
jgi:hypothetical protein